MPYRVRKSKCRRSDGRSGSWVLAYKDKSGKSHSNCHTSKSGAEAQIAAIEGPKESQGITGETTMKLTSTQLRAIIAEEVEAALTQAPRKKKASPDDAFADPKSWAEFEAGYGKRLDDRRWASLSTVYPKLTGKVGREAFDREMESRNRGTAGGGGRHAGPAAEFETLLDLLEAL